LPFCPKCGSGVVEDDNYCEKCGARLRRGLARPPGGRVPIDVEINSEPEPTPPATVDRGECKEPQAEEFKDYGSYGPSAFPRGILTEGELPLYETRPLLWIRMMGPASLMLMLMALSLILYAYVQRMEVIFVVLAVWAAGMAWMGLTWLRWKYTIYAATNRRVICQTGVVSKSYVDCPLSKVQTVYVEVSVFGRMNDFGTVRVATAGEAKVEIEWKNVKSPTKTQRVLNEIIDKYARNS